MSLENRKERDRRYNHSEKGRARYLRYYHQHAEKVNYARSRRRLRQRIAVKQEILEHGGYFKGVYVPGRSSRA